MIDGPVAVVAATGQIGRRLVPILLALGWPVIAVGRDPERLARLPAAAERRVADARDPAALARALAGARLIASCGPADLVQHILAACPTGLIRIVALGSSRRYAPEGDPVAEAACRAEAALAAQPVPAVLLLATMIYGEGGVVARLGDLARRWRALPLPGGGRARIQPIHVDDVACAVAAALVRAEAPGPPIVIAGRTPLSYADLIRQAAGPMARPVLVLPIPVWLLRPLVALAARVPRLAGAAGAVRRLWQDKLFAIDDMRHRLGIEPRPFAVTHRPDA